MPTPQCAHPPAPRPASDLPGRERTLATRRACLAAGLAVLVGCAHNPTTRSPQQTLYTSAPALDEPAAPVLPPQAKVASPARHDILPRSTWANGAPVPSLMQRMTPIRYITVHHDGMQPFFGRDRRTVAGHLETIRRLHRRRGWGDIGYHFAVDRAGRVWEARPLTYQGAHVKDHNPGNIGIVVLGNFEEQQPSPAQLAALQLQIRHLQSTYSVPTSRVRTHQEWAPTACPGTHLRSCLAQLRSNGRQG